MTICAGVLGAFYIVTQASLMLGTTSLVQGGTPLLRADLAAWFPVILIGSTSVWTAGYVQT